MIVTAANLPGDSDRLLEARRQEFALRFVDCALERLPYGLCLRSRIGERPQLLGHLRDPWILDVEWHRLSSGNSRIYRQDIPVNAARMDTPPRRRGGRSIFN